MDKEQEGIKMISSYLYSSIRDLAKDKYNTNDPDDTQFGYVLCEFLIHLENGFRKAKHIKTIKYE